MFCVFVLWLFHRLNLVIYWSSLAPKHASLWIYSPQYAGLQIFNSLFWFLVWLTLTSAKGFCWTLRTPGTLEWLVGYHCQVSVPDFDEKGWNRANYVPKTMVCSTICRFVNIVGTKCLFENIVYFHVTINMPLWKYHKLLFTKWLISTLSANI